MKNKFIWIILAVFLMAGGAYYKFYFPNSQVALKESLMHTVAAPIDHFMSAGESSCGIWYERLENGNLTNGRSNNSVKKCFQKAFKECNNKNILLVADESATEEKRIIYSYIKMIRGNDQNECIIQNFYEEHSLVAPLVDFPLTYVNTCTVLSDAIYDSCEPLFIKQDRKNRMSDAFYKEESIE